MSTYIGADLGATKLAMVCTDRSGNVLGEAWIEHAIDDLPSLVETFRRAKAQVIPTSIARVDGVGVSCAGWLDAARETVMVSANMGIEKVPLRAELKTLFDGAPVEIENDGDVTLLGEHAGGAAALHGSAVLFTLGTGVGGGVFADGGLVRGAHGLGGELGHMRVATALGRRCVCGSTGCLETALGGRWLGRTATELRDAGQSEWLCAHAQSGPLSSRDLLNAANAGDDAALDAVSAGARALADAISLLVPVLDPAVIVVGGTVAEGFGNLLLDEVRRLVREDAFLPDLREGVSIVPAQLGARAAVIGAASLARQRHPALTIA